MKDYEEIARRFLFYMTHGFEQDMPLGYSNLTWYTGLHRNLVVLENIPSPDYQWFYDPTWSYTTAQITAYEEAIFDHLIYEPKRDKNRCLQNFNENVPISRRQNNRRKELLKTTNRSELETVKTRPQPECVSGGRVKC